MTKKQEAERERRRKIDDQAVYALHCHGCPYKTCLGSNAAITYDERTERARDMIHRKGRA